MSELDSKYFAKVEESVELILRLVPDIFLILFHFIFKPNIFLSRCLADGKKTYEVPPYIFLTISGLAITIAIGFAIAAFSSIIDSFINAVTAWIGPSVNEGDLSLASLIDSAIKWSWSTYLVSSAIIVVTLASLARLFARVGGAQARKKQLERVFCYVVGCQQIHSFLLLPVLFILLLWWAFSQSFFSTITLTFFIAYIILWTALTLLRLMRKVDSSHKFPVCLGLGIMFSLLNLGIVSTIVYGSEAIPDTLKKWRNELMKQPEHRDYQVIYAESMISEDRKFVLTLAIQLKSGEPLVANVERFYLHPSSVFSSKFWHQDVKLLDSSEGNAQLIIIRPGEVKWIKIAADISSEIQKNISSNYTWSSELHLGKESIYLRNVKVDKISRLKKDEVTFGVDARTSSGSKLIDSKQENLQPGTGGN